MPSKTRRLCRRDFLLVKKLGQTHRFRYFTLIVHSSSYIGHLSRSSIVLSGSFHKHAVVRNKFRRFCFPLFKQIKPDIDIIFIPSGRMLKLDHAQINSEINSAISALSLL
jgi:ribonuclease P protein component